LNDQLTSKKESDMLRHNLLPIATLLTLSVAGFSQDAVKVVRQSEPQKALIIELSIPASQHEVWKAFTTSDGLSTWLTPGAVVDLRDGGEWTAHYPGGHTGGGTILSFTPEKELTLSAMAPEQFPVVRAQRTTARFEFISEGSSTRVRLTQTGWKSGDEWDKAYEYLAKGNAQLLWTLHRRFVSGPIDWQKEWGDMPSK
jgi:uncharacterized protein YndB with AHSA1/START domain